MARVLPGVEHETGKLVQQRIERDHQHLKGRLMRGFQTTAAAQTICQGHGFIRNLRGGFYHVGLVVESDPALPQRPAVVIGPP